MVSWYLSIFDLVHIIIIIIIIIIIGPFVTWVSLWCRPAPLISNLMSVQSIMPSWHVWQIRTKIRFVKQYGCQLHNLLPHLTMISYQEVKECAISCMSLVISTFGDNLQSELSTCLPVLVDRMGNEITRLTAVKVNVLSLTS